MRRVRYGVGMSLDGFTADVGDGPGGWWATQPTTPPSHSLLLSIPLLFGRRSYEVTLRQGVRSYPGLRTYVFSRTLKAGDYPEVTLLAEGGVATIAELRAGSGKDIWLSGGGELFRSLLDADLVDTVELGVVPILLGQGRPFLPSTSRSKHLRLTHQEAFPSGLLVLHYDVEKGAGEQGDEADKVHAPAR